VLWLDGVERRFVDEVGAMNIAFIYHGRQIRTPALSGAILPGITRDSILRLAPDLGYEVSEARIDMQEVARDIEAGRVTEAFCMGTGAVIAPVGRLGCGERDLVLNDNQPGPVARRVYEELTGIQYGRRPDPYGWTTPIPASSHGSGVAHPAATAGVPSNA
jgi:branched-chain amino acid aminotransferase